MTIHRTYWNTSELRAMHAWIKSQGTAFAARPVTDQVILAQNAVLPTDRHRDNVQWHSQAERAMERMSAAAAQIKPTPREAVQVPAYAAAPLAPAGNDQFLTVQVNHGQTGLVPMLAPGKYILEIL